MRCFILTLFISISNGSFSQLTMEYFPLETPYKYIYKGTFTHNTTKKLIIDYDTLSIKNYQNKNYNCYYFWENDPPFYFVGFNIFFWGACMYKDSSLYICPISEESEIPDLKEENFILLFPSILKKGFINTLIYSDNRKIKYTILGKDKITVNNNEYKDCIKILIEDSWDNKTPSSGYVWLKKGIGVVKWQRPTGKIHELLEYSEIEYVIIKNDSQYVYFNSKGDEKLQSELLEGQKMNSEYSRAIYNTKGQLIEELYFGSTGEMEITSIDYKYNDKSQLIQEIYHYNKNKLWVSDFIYDSNGKLIEYRSKMSIEDSDYYMHLFYKYDDKLNLYGIGKSIDNIICDRKFISTELLIKKLLYSNIHPLKKD